MPDSAGEIKGWLKCSIKAGENLPRKPRTTPSLWTAAQQKARGEVTRVSKMVPVMINQTYAFSGRITPIAIPMMKLSDNASNGSRMLPWVMRMENNADCLPGRQQIERFVLLAEMGKLIEDLARREALLGDRNRLQ